MTPRPRRGGPWSWVAVDALTMTWRRRNVFGLILLVAISGAAALAFVAKVVLPWAIYPAL
jgi:hypothetical protein